jgi:cytidine deaminase
MTKTQLIIAAKKIALKKDSGNRCVSGEVGAALKTRSGKIYKGINIDCACGIGFCAEHSAISSMLLDQESEIEMIVAVNCKGKIIPPCGRCRELIYAIDKNNLGANIIISKTETIKLSKLLPLRWQEY